MTERPSRRVVLGAALLTPLAACTSSSGSGGDGPSPSAAADPDVALRSEAIAREQALLATYDAAVAAYPRLAALLTPVRAEHAEHLAALQEPAPSASPTAVAPVTARPGITALVAAERSAARAHAVAARTASPALAQVLASLSASEASHEVALVRS